MLYSSLYGCEIITMATEYIWDPSTNSASEVTRGQNNVDPELPSLEEINQRQLNTAAKGLGQRAARAHQSSAGETDNLQAESTLLELQRELSNETDPLKQQIILSKCEALASGLVGGKPEPLKAPGEPSQEEAKDEWFEQYKDTNPGIEDALNYASTVMGNDLIEPLNDLISSDDEEVRVGALRTVEHLHKNPQNFISAEESDGISEQLEAEIASEYGESLAHAVSVLGNGVASQTISSQDALRVASKDPNLLNVLYQLASSGRIRIAL